VTDGPHQRVHGVDLDEQSRCVHYDSPLDVVALRFGCCGAFYACHACHDAVTDHPAEPWPESRAHEPAVLCGVCDGTMTVETYLQCAGACPHCGASFNPGCSRHYDRYFEGVSSRPPAREHTHGSPARHTTDAASGAGVPDASGQSHRPKQEKEDAEPREDQTAE